MSLPHELLDEILDYLSLDDEQDKQSLRNCSLVAKSWTNPSRRRLFETVEILGANIQSWLDTIPPANDELLRHVRSLSYVTRNALPWTARRPKGRVHVLRDYLPSFHKLQHLSLSHTHIPSDISKQIEIFSAFRHTLSRLALKHCTVTMSALVALINFFPNLDRLDLRYILEEVDGEPASPLRRPLIQKLHIFGFYRDGLGILDQLSELGLVFKELGVSGSSHMSSCTLSGIVDSLGVKAKRLKGLPTYRVGKYRPGTRSTLLSRCRGLQELELAVRNPGTEQVDILSSITSASIQKVSFTYWHLSQNPLQYDIDFGIFDEPLCRLVGRSGRTCELEVDFRIVGAGDAEAGATVIANSLVRFREKGRIRVVRVDRDGSERVVYPPPVHSLTLRSPTPFRC